MKTVRRTSAQPLPSRTAASLACALFPCSHATLASKPSTTPPPRQSTLTIWRRPQLRSRHLDSLLNQHTSVAPPQSRAQSREAIPSANGCPRVRSRRKRRAISARNRPTLLRRSSSSPGLDKFGVGLTPPPSAFGALPADAKALSLGGGGTPASARRRRVASLRPRRGAAATDPPARRCRGGRTR